MFRSRGVIRFRVVRVGVLGLAAASREAWKTGLRFQPQPFICPSLRSGPRIAG